MAGNILHNVPRLSPEEYRQRKIALLTGACHCPRAQATVLDPLPADANPLAQASPDKTAPT